ncbi:MAG: hypothetical protein QF775_00590, partial [archaeon]|nr:hypothetical protein [archaeon]
MTLVFSIFGILWDFISVWWWIFLPFLLFPKAKELYSFWREDVWDSTQPPKIILRVKTPPDTPRPFKAMENVYAAMWQIHDPPNPREQWIDGQYQVSMAIELVSTEGNVDFYLRIARGVRGIVESAIYAQYPEVELEEVEDYTKRIPPDIPNKEWEMWGTNYILGKPDVYPIKTYRDFFEDTSFSEEEQRVDPMSHLIESLSRLGKDEHMWIQFSMKPVTQDEDNYFERGQEIVDKLAKRPEKKKPTTSFQDVATVTRGMATGDFEPINGEEAPRPVMNPDLQLTPGERNTIAA